MTEQELDKWWAHLTVEKKEEVSNDIPYPQCTAWWNTLSPEAKQTLYNISGGRDAHDHHKWRKGNTSLT